MKKKNLALALCVLAGAALMLSSCATLGVANEGAEYFDGKKESALAKYFGYEGEVLAEGGEDFDRMVYFSNKSIVAYMDWSKTTRTKRSRYSDINDFEFLKMSDGCYVAMGNSHYVSRYNPGTRSTIGGRNGAVTVGQGGPTTYTTHRNDNGTVSGWINQFNSNVRSLGAIGWEYANSCFDAGNIGDTYYLYSITSGSATLGGEYATIYSYSLQRVDIYLDEQTQSDTQVAFHYSIPKDEYYAADRSSAISEDAAFGNVSGYEGRGYTLRMEASGMSVVALIKDGAVDEIKVIEEINEAYNKDTTLILAAMCNSFGWVNELLVFGANPDARDKDGRTALMWAAINDNAEIARILLSSGASPDLQDEDGNTALSLAMQDGNTATANALRTAGGRKRRISFSGSSSSRPSTSHSPSSSSSSSSSDYNWGLSVGVSKPVSGMLANFSNIGLSVGVESGNGPLYLLLQGDYYTFSTQSLLANVAIGKQFAGSLLGFGIYAGGGLGASSQSFIFNFDDISLAWKVFGGARFMLGPMSLRADVSYVSDIGVVLAAFAGIMF